jgi:hypothetical protein
MSATSTLFPDTGTSREALALTGIQDALSWRHVLEIVPDESFKRPGHRTIIYPDLLTKSD